MGTRKRRSVGDYDEQGSLRVDQLGQVNEEHETSEERPLILFEHAPAGCLLNDVKGDESELHAG
ncbi:hypothetical protein ACFLSF_03000 [Candidatus Bipolaricaulota bacterium]